MTEKFTPRNPDYKGFLEIPAWIDVEDNKKIIRLKIGGNVTLRPYVPKPKQPKEEKVL